MTMKFSAWVDDVNLRFIDVDGFPSYNKHQCWDLAQDYLSRCLGGGSLQTGPSPHQGYAIGVWDGFSSNGLSQWFSQAPATSTPKAGWVAVWKWGALPFYPLSHIAIVLNDLPAGMVNCMTQNPGPAHKQPLAKAGLAGYLVPKGGDTSGFSISPALSGKDLVEGLGGAIADAANNPLGAMLLSIARINKYLTDAGNWKRIGLFILGAFLLIIAVTVLLGKTPIVQTAVKELT
jgi:hypothetical protein